MRRLILPVLLVCSLSLGACNHQLNKGQSGAGIGAAGGAVLGQAIGGNTEATLIGMGFGALLGYIVGNEMDKYDRQQLNQTYERGASGQSSSWHNPDSGNSYNVTPEPAYYPTPESPCRRAEIVAMIDGKQEKTYSTACRNSAGQWELK